MLKEVKKLIDMTFFVSWDGRLHFLGLRGKIAYLNSLLNHMLAK